MQIEEIAKLQQEDDMLAFLCNSDILRYNGNGMPDSLVQISATTGSNEREIE